MSISGMFAQVAAQPASAVAARTDQILDEKPKAVADPFAPKLIDLDTLAGTDEEQLALLEGAIEAAQNTLADNVRDARFRAEVEIGFTLDAIRRRELHVEKFGTIENYGEKRWGYKRSTLYELMDTAPIRIAMSGNPDTSNRKGIEPPKPRTAIDADVAGETTKGRSKGLRRRPRSPAPLLSSCPSRRPSSSCPRGTRPARKPCVRPWRTRSRRPRRRDAS